MKKRGKPITLKKVLNILFITIIIVFFLNIIFSMVNITLPNSIAIIPIKGLIVSDGESIFELTTSADKTIEYIEKAEKNPNIKAILFDINSGGGSAVASDEIAAKIKSLEKPTLALIREAGASGAYWIASACDTVMANRMSITGSIGVIASYLEFSGLLDNYNITYQRLVAGQYKDMGSPYKNLTTEERELFQKQLDNIHEYFIAEIASNRNLSIDKVKSLSTGMFYLGQEALDLGLVDQLGNKDNALELLKHDLNLAYMNTAEFEEKTSFLDIITKTFSRQAYSVGRGIGASLTSNKDHTIIELHT